MDLQEQVNLLNEEKIKFKAEIINLTNAKDALDQMLGNSIKESFTAKHESLNKNHIINTINEQNQALIKEKEVLTAKLNELQNTIHCLGSEAQSSEG
jgi:hypothetical protein